MAMRWRWPPERLAPPLADDRIVALRKPEDEVMRSGHLGRGDDLLHRGRRIDQRDVVANGPIKQHIFLQHHANLPAQPSGIDGSDVGAVHRDATSLWNIEPLHELRQRRFARARRSDYADHLAGQDVDRHVLQNRRPVEAVAEGDVVEPYRALECRQSRAAGRGGGFGHRVQDVAEALDGDTCLVKILPEPGRGEEPDR